MRLIFATGNQGKMKEIRMVLCDLGVEILSMKEAGISVDIDENGETFEENALIKAREIAKYAEDAIVLADDSGLEIDYLNKEPGVHSSRFMGEDTSYEIKNQHILDLLKGVEEEKRSARFVCVISAVLPNGEEFVTPLREFDNVILTPHIGAGTEEAQRNIGTEVAEKLALYSDNGSTLTAVNFPEVALPAIREDVSRLLHIHKNVPGVMRQINEIFAKENINVAAQYLQTNADIGYVVMDIHSADPASVVSQLKKIDGTLKCRILY